MIDLGTGWFEVKDVSNTDLPKDQPKREDMTWESLTRYPHPQVLGYDGGSEFKSVFEETRKNWLKQATKYGL